MNTTEIKKIIYNYYPKNISPYNREDYLTSIEFKELVKMIDNKKVFPKEKKDLLLVELNSFKGVDFKDFSLFLWKDRAYNIQSIIEKKANKTKVLCINISVIVPYFTIYILNIEKKYNSLGIKNEISIDSESYKNYTYLIQSIEKTLLNIFFLTKFPDEVRDTIIDDIGFQDIELGTFTFFNAFFLDNYKHTRF